MILQKDKDRICLKNWRPLTILRTDYTIISKLLAIHISGILSSIINNDPSAYIKGRYIGEKIRTITDIINYCKAKNRSAGLLLINFEKPFDTIDWSFLDEILKIFNCGDIFRKWVRIIYTDVKSYILNNGYLFDIVHIYSWGIRQSCPHLLIYFS